MNRQDIYAEAKERIRAGEKGATVFADLAERTGRSMNAITVLYYREARRDPQSLVNTQDGPRRGRPRGATGPIQRPSVTHMVELRCRVDQLESENRRLRAHLEQARRRLVQVAA